MTNYRGELSQANIVKKGIEYGLNFDQIISMLDPNFMKDYSNFMTKVKESFDLGVPTEIQYAYILSYDNKDVKNAFKLEMPNDQIKMLINPYNEFDERYSHEVFLCFKNGIPIDIIKAFIKIAHGDHPVVRRLKYRYTNKNMPDEMVKYLFQYADTDPDKFKFIYGLWRRKKDFTMDEIDEIAKLPTTSDMLMYIYVNKYHIKESKVPELVEQELKYWVHI